MYPICMFLLLDNTVSDLLQGSGVLKTDIIGSYFQTMNSLYVKIY